MSLDNCHLLFFPLSLLPSSYLDTRKVYGTVVRRKDHIFRKDDGSYSSSDYKTHPDQYDSNFHEKVTMLMFSK